MLLAALLVSGALLHAFAGFQTVWAPAAWLAPVAFLAFSRRLSNRKAAFAAIAAGHAAAIAFGLRGGLVPLPWPVVAAVAVGSGLVRAIPYAIDARLERRLAPAAAALVFPAAVVGIEWLATRWSPFGTWGVTAYSQTSLALLQLAAATGAWGLTFLVHALAPALLAWPRARAPLVVFSAALAAAYLGGLVRLARPDAGRATPVAAVVPSNREVAEAWGGTRPRAVARAGEAERSAARGRFQAHLDRLVTRTEAASSAGARLVAWSEWTPVASEDFDALTTRLTALCRARRVLVAAAVLVVSRGDAFPRAKNLVLLIDETGAVRFAHAKSQPVLGLEDSLIAPGPGRPASAETALGRVAAVICQDLDFPWLVRTAGREGADLLLAPADDWPAVQETHARMARLRAIENGVPLLRPTANGLTLAADAFGRVLARRPPGVEVGDALAVTLPVGRVPTLYAALGDWFAFLCLAGLGLAFARTRLASPAAARAGRPRP